MAILHEGLHGHPSGSIGNVTFVRTADGRCIARLRTTPANPRTPAQQRQRRRFKQMQQFAAACHAAGLLRAFWQLYATDGRTTHNAFVRAQYRAMPGPFDPEAARLSLGNGLAPVVLSAVRPARTNHGAYVLSVESPAGGQDDDRLVGLIYNAGTGRVVMTDAGAERRHAQVKVEVPASWAEHDQDALFAYTFAYRHEAGATVRLSESSARKVTPAPFEVPAPEVPAARPHERPNTPRAAPPPPESDAGGR